MKTMTVLEVPKVLALRRRPGVGSTLDILFIPPTNRWRSRGDVKCHVMLFVGLSV